MVGGGWGRGGELVFNWGFLVCSVKGVKGADGRPATWMHVTPRN